MLRAPAIVCLSLLLCAATRALAAEPATTFTLANGLQVVVLPDHRLPVVTHAVYYRAGSADDPPGQTGIAHYLEHLMFKGTKRFPNGQYDLIVTRAGGTNNAYTSNDKTYYYEQVLKDGLASVMELDADRMVGLDVAGSEAEHELKVVLEERLSYLGDPESVLANNAGRALYGRGVYAHPVLGEPAETSALTLAAALAFHARFYAPDQAIVVVAGDAEPGTVRALAEATYGKLPASPVPPTRDWTSMPVQCPDGLVEERHERVARDKAIAYFVTPGAASLGVQTAAALSLLADILQDQAASPIWRSLLDQDAPVSDLSAGYELKLAAGEFSITLTAGQGAQASQIRAALMQALTRLRQRGIDAPVLEAAKRRQLAERLLRADDQLGEATRYGEQLAIGRSLAEIEAEPTTITSVTLADVNAVLRDFLPNRCFTIALLERDTASAGTRQRPAAPLSTRAVH